MGGSVRRATGGGVLQQSHHPPKAKRVIYLFMSGGPSQLDLFDYKPLLNELNGQELPDSVRRGQRLTGMSANQASLPLAGSIFKFQQHGQSARGSAICCRTRPRWPTTSASSSRCTPRRSITTRRSRSSKPVPRSPGRPSHRGLAQLRAGERNENLPAFVRADHQGQGRPAAVRPAVGQRVSAVACTRACSSARARIRCCI